MWEVMWTAQDESAWCRVLWDITVCVEAMEGGDIMDLSAGQSSWHTWCQCAAPCHTVRGLRWVYFTADLQTGQLLVRVRRGGQCDVWGDAMFAGDVRVS